MVELPNRQQAGKERPLGFRPPGGQAQPFSPMRTTRTEAAMVFAGFEGRGFLLQVLLDLVANRRPSV
jgi:hypothetical protein